MERGRHEDSSARCGHYRCPDQRCVLRAVTGAACRPCNRQNGKDSEPAATAINEQPDPFRLSESLRPAQVIAHPDVQDTLVIDLVDAPYRPRESCPVHAWQVADDAHGSPRGVSGADVGSSRR